jgi:hypothetical protein
MESVSESYRLRNRKALGVLIRPTGETPHRLALGIQPLGPQRLEAPPQQFDFQPLRFLAKSMTDSAAIDCHR